MKLGKFEFSLLGIVIAYLVIFSFLYLQRGNIEFLMYIFVVAFFLVLVSFLHIKYRFSREVLVGLVIWGFLHMAGGFFRVGTGVLYGYWIFPFLRYDQLVHFFGFGVSTLLIYYILKPNLKKTKPSNFVIIIFAGMGIGALNEIVEFIAVLLLPQTGVGGYNNTMMDIVFNTFGAICAMIYARFRDRPE